MTPNEVSNEIPLPARHAIQAMRSPGYAAGRTCEAAIFDPNPPSNEEVIAAGRWKYGLADESS